LGKTCPKRNSKPSSTSPAEGILNADELAMIKAIVDLEDLHASDVMTPRVDFLGLDLADPRRIPSPSPAARAATS
jgi:CBS domain containing-hemolysin-like protein